MNNGWISLHRKIRNSPAYSDPFLFKLWAHCTLKATYVEYEQQIGTEKITLQPGQFITGRDALADEYNRGVQPKLLVKPLSLWRKLKILEDMQLLNIQSTNKYSVITVLNWNEDQQSEQLMNNKRTTNEQQMNTNNNSNNSNNKNKEKDTVHQDELFESWWNLYNNKKGKVKCLAKYQSLLKKHSHETMMTGTNKYLHHREDLVRRAGFLPQQQNPFTFLNGEHFNDEYQVENGVVTNQTTETQYKPYDAKDYLRSE